MLQRRRSSTNQQPQLIRTLSFEWTNRVRRLSSLRATGQTPSPGDPNSYFNFNSETNSPTSSSRLLTPSIEMNSPFPPSSKTSIIAPTTPLSEWSEYLKSETVEQEVGPLEKKVVAVIPVGRTSSMSTRSLKTPQDWKAMLGEYDIVSETSEVSLLSTRTTAGKSTRNDLPSTPSISPTLPSQLLSPLQISSYSCNSNSPASSTSRPLRFNQNPPETLGYGNSLSTFQFNHPPPPLLSLPPSVQSKLSADKNRRLKEVGPVVTHHMITRKASVVELAASATSAVAEEAEAEAVTSSPDLSSNRGGGALNWLGMAVEDRELLNKSGAEKKLTAVKVAKPSKRRPRELDEFSLATARIKSTARKLARKPIGYTPRPPNAWILYRSEQIRILKTDRDVSQKPQSDISKLIGYMWREEPAEFKKMYEALAETAKAEHALKYPGYRFKPIRRREKSLSPLDDYPSEVIGSYYQTHSDSPHNTRASAVGNHTFTASVRYHSNSHPQQQQQQQEQQQQQQQPQPQYRNSSYVPQSQPFYQTSYNNLGYPIPQAVTSTPAFYYDLQTIPTPPNPGAYHYSSSSEIISPDINVDPNVAAFSASLGEDSEATYGSIPPQAVFDPNTYSPNHFDANQTTTAAWNEFEGSTTTRWFPSPPPDGNFLPPSMSAPASTSNFNPIQSIYNTFGLPQHRSSLGSNYVFIDRNLVMTPRESKPDENWLPVTGISQSPLPFAYNDKINASSSPMDLTQ